MTIGAGKRSRTLLLLVTLMAVAACALQSPPPEPVSCPIAERIVVLPVTVLSATGGNGQPTPHTINRSDIGALAFDQLLAEYFKDRPAVTMIGPAQLEALAADFTAGDQASIAKIVATHGQAQAVLICTLHRFIEREGSSYSTDQPASIAFDFKLIEAGTGDLLCRGSHDETQQALSDNVLNLPTAANRGFKWLTARELLQEAINKKFNDCPSLACH